LIEEDKPEIWGHGNGVLIRCSRVEIAYKIADTGLTTSRTEPLNLQLYGSQSHYDSNFKNYIYMSEEQYCYSSHKTAVRPTLK